MSVAVIADHEVGVAVAAEVAGKAGGGRIAPGREALDQRVCRAGARDQGPVVRPGVEGRQAQAEPVEIAEEERCRVLADGVGLGRLRAGR